MKRFSEEIFPAHEFARIMDYDRPEYHGDTDAEYFQVFSGTITYARGSDGLWYPHYSTLKLCGHKVRGPHSLIGIAKLWCESAAKGGDA